MRFAVVATLLVIATTLLLSCSGSNDPVPVVQELAARITIDSSAALNGQEVTLSLRLDPLEGDRAIDSLNSLDFLVTYDDSGLTFLDAANGTGISDWEYFTWRHSPPGRYSKTNTIRLMSYRDLENGAHHPNGQQMPSGELFKLTFVVTSNRARVGREPEVTFWSAECTDNVLVDVDNPEHLHFARYLLSNSGLSRMFDSLDCPRRYSLSPDLEFVSGAVKILEPPDDRPDPPITVSIESVSGQAGDTVQASISIEYALAPPYVPPALGGLKFTFLYDTTAITAIDVVRGDQLSEWDYFSGRIRPLTGWTRFQSSITVVSILEMNDGAPSTGKPRPKGELAVVRFVLQHDLSIADFCNAATFWSGTTGDNLLIDASGNTGLLPLPEQSGLLFALSYDTVNCGGAVESCQSIVRYLKSGCPK